MSVLIGVKVIWQREKLHRRICGPESKLGDFMNRKVYACSTWDVNSQLCVSDVHQTYCVCTLQRKLALEGGSVLKEKIPWNPAGLFPEALTPGTPSYWLQIAVSVSKNNCVKPCNLPKQQQVSFNLLPLAVGAHLLLQFHPKGVQLIHFSKVVLGCELKHGPSVIAASERAEERWSVLGEALESHKCLFRSPVGVELEKTSPCCQKPVERTFLCLSSWRGFTVCVIYEKPTKARPDFAGQYTNGTYREFWGVLIGVWEHTAPEETPPRGPCFTSTSSGQAGFPRWRLDLHRGASGGSFLVGFLGMGRLLAIAVLSEQWFRGLVTNLKSLGFGYAENQVGTNSRKKARKQRRCIEDIRNSSELYFGVRLVYAVETFSAGEEVLTRANSFFFATSKKQIHLRFCRVQPD
ncbi:hypothetical protein Anapl_04773 [Anas platyrhynchos]|uniref:Uncharacterized protein n=1 Tax=Anas platyrhynchos TaxID=8839 RepID=R0JUE7_ANAPL|nr:hypothetical protein Anapl_04773 [Anas platyrhynchos]